MSFEQVDLDRLGRGLHLRERFFECLDALFGNREADGLFGPGNILRDALRLGAPEFGITPRHRVAAVRIGATARPAWRIAGRQCQGQCERRDDQGAASDDTGHVPALHVAALKRLSPDTG